MNGRSRTASAPLISVIVPVFGDVRHLPPALHSIRIQNADRCEVIVVDDGCTKPVDDLARAIIPDALVLRQANAGPAAARNRGLGAASGEFITFLDADDRWSEHALAQLARGFEDAPLADVVHGHVRNLESFAEEASGKEHWLGEPYLSFSVAALLARRHALLSVGPFDETLRLCEDVDFFMRMHERGLRRLTIPDVVLEYRQHPASLTALTPPQSHGYAANWMRLLHRGRKRRAEAPDKPQAQVQATVSPPRYSVIMVVREGRRYLPAALNCIRRQSVAPSEIVAIVGPSNDGTLAYLSGQGDVRVVLQTGDGLAQARNQGVAEAGEDLIAFLDHDDLWKPRKLEMQLALLGLFAKPAACITNFRLVRDADTDDPARVEEVAGQPQRLGWTPSALIAHRELFNTVGGFDPAADTGCDTDWFRRLRSLQAPCAVAAGALLDKRVHESNLSRDIARNRAAMFRVIHKHRVEQRSG